MRDVYQEQLWNLNQELIQMGAACEEIIDLASKALTDYSQALEEETAHVGATIDESERTIETICLKLLLRQQPVAGDLRQISAAMKMITDMERIGDQAEDIVDLIPKMQRAPEEHSSQIEEMAKAAKYTVNQAVDEEYHVVYFHCAGAGEKWELLKDGAPVCLTAVSHAMSVPNAFTMAYASAVLRGQAEVVTDQGEWTRAMLQLCSAFDPKGMGRFMECVEKNGPATRVIRITPQELTGKENTAVEKHHHHHD